MSKKQQLRLKTVDVSDLIALKTQSLLAPRLSAHPDPAYKNAIRHKTENAPILVNALKLAKKQEIMRHKVQQLVDEAKSSPLRTANLKDSLKQFPKREKSIKNSNPYRYFQSSKSERIMPDYTIANDPVLHINFTRIMKDKHAYRFKSNSIASRAYTESDLPIEPRKNLLKNKLPSKRMEESFGSSLQPWLLTQEANSFPMPHK